MTIIDDLIRDEGLRLKPYQDTVGKTTIGVGRNLDDVGISEEEARYLLANDLSRVETDLDRELPWWRTRPAGVQDSLRNLCFQLGLGGLLQFKRMLACLQAGDYVGARSAAWDSLWARQVPERAARVIAQFRDGP